VSDTFSASSADRPWRLQRGRCAGIRIISTVTERLGLRDEDAAPSRQVLHDHANCSSATVLVVLDELMRERRPGRGEHLVIMAFGPGLTLYLALLRVR
jgi:alkylresorcinol/alkylpyrone synthase